MKSIVLADDYEQSDLKPAALLAKYIDMLKADAEMFLLRGQIQKDACCPACGAGHGPEGFQKFLFTYRECPQCGTLFVSPRPGDEAVLKFYREAPSRKFWSGQLSEATRVQRKEKIIKPRMEWVADSAAEHCPSAEHWVDLHVSQPRYLEAMATVTRMARRTATCPYFDPAGKVPEGIAIAPEPWWQTFGLKADVVTAFELFDQTSDVGGLLDMIGRTLDRGGLLFMTCILSSGFDLKELGVHARNLFPPDRLNAFTVRGLKGLLEARGFELLEFSTPGVLDVDIVRRALEADPAVPVSGFVKDLVLHQSDEVRHSFQEFLQANMLSSYGRVLARKTGE